MLIMTVTLPVGRPLIGFGSYSLAFAIAHDVQAQTGQRKSSQKTKGVHVAKNVDISSHKHQYRDGNTGSQSNGVVRRST